MLRTPPSNIKDKLFVCLFVCFFFPHTKSIVAVAKQELIEWECNKVVWSREDYPFLVWSENDLPFPTGVCFHSCAQCWPRLWLLWPVESWSSQTPSQQFWSVTYVWVCKGTCFLNTQGMCYFMFTFLMARRVTIGAESVFGRKFQPTSTRIEPSVRADGQETFAVHVHSTVDTTKPLKLAEIT